MKLPTDKSIRVQLLISLLTPLCLLWLISTIVAYFLAVSFANDSYDRELLNSADSVVTRLRFNGKIVWADLPQAAQDILRHHNRDKFYYQVLNQKGECISGDSILKGPFRELDSRIPRFRFAEINGDMVRVARIRVHVPDLPHETVLVQVAETLNSRHILTQQILLSIVVPQIILILLGAFAVSHGISKGLKPLKELKSDLERRSQFDLSPVETAGKALEIKPLVSAINNLLSRLRNDIETQKRFVANAAHQFRTPLAGLKTYVYYAKRLASDEPSEQERAMRSKQIMTVLDQIDSGSDRMTNLANKLLSLAKAEPDSNGENFQSVDLNLIVSEITAELVGEAMKKHLDLEFLGSDGPALVKGDAANLTELTENLIENAVLYTEPGGRILVSIVNSGHVLLAVEDNGPGIPPEERERVFERFYRVLGTDAPGSGLGLPIVKEIACAHKAEVQITSGAGGKGTTITVTFPSHKSDEILEKY